MLDTIPSSHPEQFEGTSDILAGLLTGDAPSPEVECFLRLLPGALASRRDFVALARSLLETMSEAYSCRVGYYSARGPFEGQVFVARIGDLAYGDAVSRVHGVAVGALTRASGEGLVLGGPGLPFLVSPDGLDVAFVWLADAFTGAFVLSRETDPFSAEARKNASVCAAVCAELLALGADLARLESETRHDFLTGLLNRSYFEHALPAEIERSKRSGSGFSLVFMDLDGFKRFNDSFGHRRGDEFLRRVGTTLTESLRAADTATRYGGDEFGLILPETSPDQAATTLTRIKERIEAAAGLVSAESMVSASFGLAYFPGDGTNSEQLIAIADSRLYHAKAQNRIVTVDTREEQEPRATT
jgi:diguanylate cyclase (GGDEF)-like protein